jgi:hypothetical protein
MGVNFRDWLRQELSTRKAEFGRLATASVMVVAVSRHAWRGHRLIKGAKIEVDGETVEKKEATTQPRWNLLPDEVKVRFDLLDNGVESLLAQFCVGRRRPKAAAEDDEVADGRGLVLRRGVYAVDAAHFPALKARMRNARERWDEEADRLCSEEGYGELVALVREKVGPEHADRVLPLIPDRGPLRAKFGLQFYRLPIRLDPEEAADADEAEGAIEALYEIIEAGVREPREELARVALNVAVQLAVKVGADVKPFRPTRTTESGETLAVARRIREPSVLALDTALQEFANKARYADPELKIAVDRLRRAVPGAPGAAAFAAALRSDDAKALEVGGLAFEVAERALDEASMCAAVAAAL